MAHRLLQQYAEVLPLYGGGVLELVNHDVLQLRADLLEDEGRVAVADERVEQLLRVAEQETVGLLIQLPHFRLDAVEQAQLTKVAQGKLCTLIESPLSWTFVDGQAQQVTQRTIGKGVNLLAARVGLGVPLRRVAETVGHRGVLDGRIEGAALQFQEETGNAAAFVREIVNRQSFLFQCGEERLGDVCHTLLGCCTKLAQCLGITVEESFLRQSLVQGFALCLVVVSEDGASELLYLSDDVP